MLIVCFICLGSCCVLFVSYPPTQSLSSREVTISLCCVHDSHTRIYSLTSFMNIHDQRYLCRTLDFNRATLFTWVPPRSLPPLEFCPSSYMQFFILIPFGILWIFGSSFVQAITEGELTWL